MTPRIAIVLGDPAGIGPELIARLLVEDEVRSAARTVVLGDPWLLERGAATAGVAVAATPTDDPAQLATAAGPLLLAMSTVAPSEITVGEASAAGGRAALSALARAVSLAREGHVDAVLFAPLNKQSLHLAGFGFEDELRWLAHEIGFDGYLSELNVLDELWTSRVTSHVPLRDVAGLVTEQGVIDAVTLIDAELRRAGRTQPRIGVAGLNPHAGDGGNFGREEIDIIAPAVERLRAQRIDAQGPYPADTVFVRAFDGAFDAVVTMYHDQGQIAMKLKGFGRGVTVLGGLPVPVTTPAHGTAYDIAGSGTARLASTLHAFRIAAQMGRRARGRLG